MAWPKIEVSETARCKLAKASGALNMIAIPFCLILLGTGSFIVDAMKDKMNLIEGLNMEVLPGFMITVGLLGVISCAFGAKVCWTNHLPKKRKYWSKYLLPSVCMTLFVFLCIFVSAIVCYAQISSLEDSFGRGISVAMTKYKSHAFTKTQLDELQIEYSCCGSQTYTDWFNIQWIHDEYLSNPIKAVAKKNSAKGEYTNDDVPFSCCAYTSMRPCIHHDVHDNKKHFSYDYRTGVTLHTRGCKDALTDLYGRKILAEVGATVFVISVVELALVIIIRILQTAIDSSVEADDPDEPSVAYIFPFGRTAMKSVAKGIKKYHKGKGDDKATTLPLLDAHGHEIVEDDDQGTDSFFDDSTFDTVSQDSVKANLANVDEHIYEEITQPLDDHYVGEITEPLDDRYVGEITEPLDDRYVGMPTASHNQEMNSVERSLFNGSRIYQQSGSIPNIPPPPPPPPVPDFQLSHVYSGTEPQYANIPYYRGSNQSHIDAPHGSGLYRTIQSQGSMTNGMFPAPPSGLIRASNQSINAPPSGLIRAGNQSINAPPSGLIRDSYQSINAPPSGLIRDNYQSINAPPSGLIRDSYQSINEQGSRRSLPYTSH